MPLSPSLLPPPAPLDLVKFVEDFLSNLHSMPRPCVAERVWNLGKRRQGKGRGYGGGGRGEQIHDADRWVSSDDASGFQSPGG